MATFKEWFEGKDDLGYRCDAFIDLLEQYAAGEGDLYDIEAWLQTAYNQGYFHAMSQKDEAV